MLGNEKCNMSSAVRILDHLFRSYSFDLTVYLKEGSPAVSHTVFDGNDAHNVDENSNNSLAVGLDESLFEWVSAELNNIYQPYAAIERSSSLLQLSPDTTADNDNLPPL